MIDALLVPFQFEFGRQALVVASLVAATCAVLSCFLVLRGWALLGDAISHGVLPGIVLAYVLGLPLLLGAFAAGLFCSFATGYLAEHSRVKEDTVMGIVFSGMFAAGLVLHTSIRADVHLDQILFGNILGLEADDIWRTTSIAALTLATIVALRRDLLLWSFDETHARAAGLRVTWLRYGFLALLSLAIVGAMEAVGIILVIALLIAPGATAFLVADRFATMLALSVLVAVASAVSGVLVSFAIDAATAPTIVLALTAFFLAAFIFSPKRGLFAARRARRRAVTS